LCVFNYQKNGKETITIATETVIKNCHIFILLEKNFSKKVRTDFSNKRKNEDNI